jgi:LmbE family N-acetylglucosaminyl deacetylase
LRVSEDLALQREGELHCAAAALGLREVHLLGYRDSGMAGSAANSHPDALVQAPTQRVASRLGELIRMIGPQVVMTFGPNGGYRHPDHIAMHRAAVAAWEQVAAQRLYYTALPRRLVRVAARLLPIVGIDPQRLGSNGDINLLDMLADELSVSARMRVGPFLAAKQRAMACHASQASGGWAGMDRLPAWVTRRWMATETFHRARPALAPDEPVETDLFHGVTHGGD